MTAAETRMGAKEEEAAGMTARSCSLQRMVRRDCGIGIYRRRLPLSGELAECR